MPNLAKELGNESVVEVVAIKATNKEDKRRELLSQSQIMKVWGGLRKEWVNAVITSINVDKESWRMPNLKHIPGKLHLQG